MKFKITTLFLLMTSLVSCSSLDIDAMTKKMYNVPSFGTSQFDNTKYIRLSQMVCGSIMFELYQDTQKSKQGVALLKAGSREIANVGDGDSLHIKLDGRTYSLESSDAVTEYETIQLEYGVTMSFSHKSYVVPEELIRSAASSNVFLAKVNMLNDTFIEGRCSILTLQENREQLGKTGVEITKKNVDDVNKIATVIGFREFVKMMDSTSW